MKICLLVVTETKKSSRTKQIRVRTHIYKIFSSSERFSEREREREISTGIVKFPSVQLAFIAIISYICCLTSLAMLIGNMSLTRKKL